MIERCVVCGRIAVHWHHLVKRIWGGEETMPVCFECHETWECTDAAWRPGETREWVKAVKRERLQRLLARDPRFHVLVPEHMKGDVT